MNARRNVTALALLSIALIPIAVIAIAVVSTSLSARADPAAGATCAAKLSKDGKAIYSASMAKKPAPNTYQRIVEDEVTRLVKDHTIQVDNAIGNGMVAGDCVKSAVQ